MFADPPGQNRDAGARGRPTVIANPADDDGFRALIERFVISGGRRPEDLQAALRPLYPSAVVRPRSLAGELVEIWYVYRDGHWIGGGR